MSRFSPKAPTWESVLPKVIAFIFFIPFYLLVIGLWLLFIFPFKLYRRIVTYIAYLRDTQLGPPLTGMAAGQIRDLSQLHSKPGAVQVACLIFRGPLNFEEIKEAFLRRVIIRIDPEKDYPTMVYPQLQKYVVNMMGYPFLKPDKKFDLSNHFNLYEPKGSTRSVGKAELKSIWESLMTKPFPQKRSPWEVIIIDNYSPDDGELEEWNRLGVGKRDQCTFTKDEHYWAGFIRIHHSLGDGFSVQKMLSHMSETEYNPHFPIKLSSLQRFLWKLRMLCLGPFDLLERLLRQAEGYHELHRPYSEFSKDYFVVESPLISSNQVRDIKSKFKVAYTTILISAISGGLRSYFVKRGKEVPRTMSAAIPVAIKHHSGKLGNEYSLAVVPYAVNIKNPVERVRWIQRELRSLLSSSWIKMFDLLVDSYSSLPTQLFQRLTEKSLVYSSTFSTMPGPTECMKAFDCTLVEVNYSYGTGPDSAGFGISSLTYAGCFRFVFFIDRNVIGSREAAQELVRAIYDELDILDRCFDESEESDPETIILNTKYSSEDKQWIEMENKDVH